MALCALLYAIARVADKGAKRADMFLDAHYQERKVHDKLADAVRDLSDNVKFIRNE